MNVVRISFDGGTPCNVPSRGYGIGYGSYAINGGEPKRVSHERPMSNNVAEILTLVVAIESLQCDPSSTRLVIEGDSQVALGRCLPPRKKKQKWSSPDFQTACRMLGELTKMFHSIETVWRPRALSVSEFGH